MDQKMASQCLCLAMLLLILISLPAYQANSDVNSLFSAETGAVECKSEAKNCPSFFKLYDDSSRGLEIREYKRTAWISVAVNSHHLSDATNQGYLSIFRYIRGDNAQNRLIGNGTLTAPLLTDDFYDSSGSSSSSSSFYVSVPLTPQTELPVTAVTDDDLPTPNVGSGIEISKWGPAYVAVVRFPGYVTESGVNAEAERLRSLLAYTRWSSSLARGPGIPTFSVAQYASPDSSTPAAQRLNEIWIRLHLEPPSSPSPSPSDDDVVEFNWPMEDISVEASAPASALSPADDDDEGCDGYDDDDDDDDDVEAGSAPAPSPAPGSSSSVSTVTSKSWPGRKWWYPHDAQAGAKVGIPMRKFWLAGTNAKQQQEKGKLFWPFNAGN